MPKVCLLISSSSNKREENAKSGLLMEEKDNRKEKALMFTGSNIPQDKFHLKLAKWIFFRRSLHESIREN